MYIILKWDSPKLFSISLKGTYLQVSSVLLCFYQNEICFAETYYSDSRNLYSSKNIVTNFNTFCKTLLGLWNFEIMCIFIKIYLDISIKRRSIPILVLGSIILQASIMDTYKNELASLLAWLLWSVLGGYYSPKWKTVKNGGIRLQGFVPW